MKVFFILFYFHEIIKFLSVSSVNNRATWPSSVRRGVSDRTGIIRTIIITATTIPTNATMATSGQATTTTVGATTEAVVNEEEPVAITTKRRILNVKSRS